MWDMRRLRYVLMMRAIMLRNDFQTVEALGIPFLPCRSGVTYQGFSLPADVAGYRHRSPSERPTTVAPTGVVSCEMLRCRRARFDLDDR